MSGLTGAAEADRVAGNTEGDLPAPALVIMLRLRWFTRLRWVFLAAAVVGLVLDRLLFGRFVRPPALLAVLAALGVVNIVWTRLSHQLFRGVRSGAAEPEALSPRLEMFANAQVAADLLLLTAILRYTGGAESPLAIFYLFHMAIVSLLLKRWQAILQGVWAVLLYSGLVIGEWRQWLTPHHPLLPDSSVGLYAQGQFVLATLVGVGFGILGVLYFTLEIAARLKKRERQLREANTALRASQEAIRELQQRRSRFMQTAAYQLKGPLATIQTLAELIRSRIVPPQSLRDTCAKIMRRCQEGISQVTELLTLARIQEGAPAAQGVPADVREALADLDRRFRPLAEAKRLNLRWDVPDGSLKVCVDPQALRDCLGNLIDNAIKYSDGPGQVTVTVTRKLSDGRVNALAINVSDQGMGIDPDLLHARDGRPGHEPVFDAFRRGNNAIAAGIPGSGLGLAIVRAVVEQAGGRVLVSGRHGGGSSFTVILPACGAIDDPPVVPKPAAARA